MEGVPDRYVHLSFAPGLNGFPFLIPTFSGVAIPDRERRRILPPTGLPGTVAERIRAALPGLAPSQRRAGRVLLERRADVIHLSVSEVAAAAHVGIGTVVRACQSLGFTGFQDAKIALSRDLLPVEEQPVEDINAGDGPREVLVKVAAESGEMLRRAAASVDPEDLRAAVVLVHAARRVLLIGTGTSGQLAQDAAYRLLTAGVAAEAPADARVQHVRARLLEPGDVAVAVSHSGATHETIAAARSARDAGAAVVAVTSFSTSPLTGVADVVLVAGGQGSTYRTEPMASRFAHLLVLEALFVCLELADPTRAATARDLAAGVLAVPHRPAG